MATVSLVGRLGADPKVFNNGDAVSLNVAWSERLKDAAGEWVDSPTIWVTVKVRGRQAQNVADSLTKGMLVVCHGELRPEMWASDQGEKTVFVLWAKYVSPALMGQVAMVSKPSNSPTPRDDGDREPPFNPL